jgi:glycosyltransferase involved in cell wall biosynthesis
MKSRLKIVHTESHCQWGGQEMRVFNESRWMSQRGHHIVIIAPKDSVIYEKARQESWEIYDVSFNELGMLKDFFRMRRLLKKIQPDVLNTHGNIDSKVVLAAAAGLGIPCVIRSRHSTPRIKDLWYNRILYRKLSHYIFTSAQFVKDQIVRDLGVSENKVFSLPSGFFIPSHLPEHEEARLALAIELSLSHDTRFIGFVGRLSSEKGLPFLIEAFFKIKDIFPGHHLVLIGKGDMLQRLKQQVRHYNIHDRVHFLGYRDNPWSYFRAYDCFMLVSSRYEAAAKVIQQAMYAGCPVIGTDAGGIPDIVIHKETGLLVPPDNSEQLAEAILQTLENPDVAKHRAEKAFRYVCDNHTIDVMGERILGLYERLLS